MTDRATELRRQADQVRSAADRCGEIRRQLAPLRDDLHDLFHRAAELHRAGVWSGSAEQLRRNELDDTATRVDAVGRDIDDTMAALWARQVALDLRADSLEQSLISLAFGDADG